PCECHHRRADVDPVVASGGRKVVAQETLGKASSADTELEDAPGVAEVGVGDQVCRGKVLVETLRVLPAPDTIIKCPRGGPAQRLLDGGGRHLRLTFGCAAGPYLWAFALALPLTTLRAAGTDGTSQRHSAVAATAPTSCAPMKPGAAGRMPANVSVAA